MSDDPQTSRNDPVAGDAGAGTRSRTRCSTRPAATMASTSRSHRAGRRGSSLTSGAASCRRRTASSCCRSTPSRRASALDNIAAQILRRSHAVLAAVRCQRRHAPGRTHRNARPRAAHHHAGRRQRAPRYEPRLLSHADDGRVQCEPGAAGCDRGADRSAGDSTVGRQGGFQLKFTLGQEFARWRSFTTPASSTRVSA